MSVLIQIRLCCHVRLVCVYDPSAWKDSISLAVRVVVNIAVVAVLEEMIVRSSRRGVALLAVRATHASRHLIAPAANPEAADEQPIQMGERAAGHGLRHHPMPDC